MLTFIVIHSFLYCALWLYLLKMRHNFTSARYHQVTALQKTMESLRDTIASVERINENISQLRKQIEDIDENGGNSADWWKNDN